MKKIALSAVHVLTSGANAATFNSPFEAGDSDLFKGVTDLKQLSAAEPWICLPSG